MVWIQGTACSFLFKKTTSGEINTLPDTAGIYAIRVKHKTDKYDEWFLLYIGRTKNVIKRIKQHFTKSHLISKCLRVFPEIEIDILYHECPKERLSNIEMVLIHKYRPMLNGYTFKWRKREEYSKYSYLYRAHYLDKENNSHNVK